jgi:hypothetical protein
MGDHRIDLDLALISITTPAPSWPRIAGNNRSGSAPDSVNSSVWQTPVALIDEHFALARPVESHG